MLFRPADSSKDIVDFYRRYLLSTFRTNRDYYNKQMAEQLSKDNVISNGPFISMSDSFKKEMSIRQLVEEGYLCKSILDLDKLHPDRALYKHQVEAIKKATNDNNLVITTGTGSGKTECFLIPVINHLLKEKENGTLNPGVRTLIIYPMNALVNDQITRLRKVLGDCEDITFGKYTGETLYTYKEAYDAFVEREGFEPKKNELISREQMQETPPNILITNYAMLEFLLLRPGDNVFFNETNAQKWHSIVLDEAHSYGGATGIEVGSLLKRVKAMLRRNDLQFILTSATLGGKDDNPKIVNFAESLCNTDFDNNSIIRSVTIPPEKPDAIERLDFEIYRQLATRIRENYPASDNIEFLKNNRVEIIPDDDIEKSLEKTLYSMIVHDSFYYEFRRALLDKTKALNQLALELKTNTDDISDFIAVASNAVINDDKLFEARYHMFIRGIEGVFVTLSPSNKLFLRQMETYKEDPFDEDDVGYKAYEISFCHNCEAVFIVGQTDQSGHLIQVSKFDDDYAPEVYLLDGDYDPEDEENETEEDDKKYLLCSKCGAITHASSNEGLNCGHERINWNRVIKVKERGEILKSCPCCHTKNSQRSILRPYFLGNEAATAVIATALYDVLPDTKITKTIKKSEDSFFGTGTTETQEVSKEPLVKQFLTFSDNRQAAAFFASYLQNTYETSLLKRIMTQVCIDNAEIMSKGISLNSFVSKLEDVMTKYKVCGEDERHKQAWLTVLREMVNYKAKNSLQSEGTLYFDFDIEMPEHPDIGSAEEVTNLVKILLKQVVKDGCIKPPITLTESDFSEYAFGKKINGYQESHSKSQYTKSWLPKDGNDNSRTKVLKKLFPDKDDDFIKRLLKSIWAIITKQNILVYDSTESKYIINNEKIIVKKVNELFRCNECKTITPYNYKGKCCNINCGGQLLPFDAEIIKRDDHYKRLYSELHIDTLVAKEHTAQLGNKLAYDYQNDFINEKINVLSCSTTFEMGVDVGTLETVFMRNMPPSPANYAQRAGRAGRSAKSAAYALTYCPNNSHDLNFFRNPVSMIIGSVKPPAFNVDNEKIVLRHIFASAFSFFWRTHPEYYKHSIGEFVDDDGIYAFRDYLYSEPDDLKDYLNSVVSFELQKIYDIENFGWVDKLFSDDINNPGVFDIAEEKYEADNKQLKDALTRIERERNSLTPGTKEYNIVNWKSISISNSIRTLKDQQLISFLSQNNLIPKYGFPVDTVDLKSLGNGGSLSSLSLNRDLFSAISEYAPESQVVADGKLITSRYVRKLGSYEWPKYNYITCSHCNTLNRTLWTDDLPENCKQCGQPLNKLGRRTYIIPKFGFIVDNKEPERVGTSKPERTYKGSISYIGDGDKIEKCNYSINGKKVVVGTSKMDELAVLNTSNFYICDECGYGEIHENSFDLRRESSHFKSDGYHCSCDTLTRYSLGHEFQTDVVQLQFESENITDSDKAWTILYALIEGLCKQLNIDRNEISGCLHWYNNPSFGGLGNFDFILFDNTPGGAGYVRNLRNCSTITGMLNNGLRIVSECDCGGDAADTACYSCLCNYYNQKQHDILQRRFAIEFFESLKCGNSSFVCEKLADEDDLIAEREGLLSVFNNDGQDQSSMAYRQIWSYIESDTEDNDEIAFFEEIKTNTTLDGKEKPFYGGSVRVIETNKTITTDLLWKKSKVAFFLKENKDSYEAMKATDWKAFCLEESFTINELISSIKGE